MDWNGLLNQCRRKNKQGDDGRANIAHESRTEIERDYDRILFSTPVRRLADKTQVFPLEINDSVRTRLTHSHEVSNLARSIGIACVFNSVDIFPENLQPKRNVPALLAAIGLAHDLGNPPFGHQGEFAIRAWFESNKDNVFSGCDELNEAMKHDFLQFEGNAQTLRLVTKLQVMNDNFGLNLTYATLAALMKYTVASDKTEEGHVARKKPGYFQSESDVVNDVWNETGIIEGSRHPLTYVMEACDDIAYAVMDAEDAVKKGLVSFPDLVSYLEHHGGEDALVRTVILQSRQKYDEHRKMNLSPSELNDITAQMFRVYAIKIMIDEVTKTFETRIGDMLERPLENDLVSLSKADELCSLLKKFDYQHAYRHKSVLEIELRGYNVVTGLMDMLWRCITERKRPDDPASERKDPFTKYGYGRISENYRRVFENKENSMPIRYKEAQLLTDMISGMTDSYAIALYDELRKLDAGHSS